MSLNDVAWDGTCSTFYIGSKKLQPVSVELPKVETKTEKVVRLGEGIARKRTVGRVEVGELIVEFDLADYANVVLPSFPVHGGSLKEYNMVTQVQHPSVSGVYKALCEGCRFLTSEGPKIEPTEKALTKKLTISVMRLWESGVDNKYKHAGGPLLGELPVSATVSVLLQF